MYHARLLGMPNSVALNHSSKYGIKISWSRNASLDNMYRGKRGKRGLPTSRSRDHVGRMEGIRLYIASRGASTAPGPRPPRSTPWPGRTEPTRNSCIKNNREAIEKVLKNFSELCRSLRPFYMRNKSRRFFSHIWWIKIKYIKKINTNLIKN